jgi:hypothetical protein
MRRRQFLKLIGGVTVGLLSPLIAKEKETTSSFDHIYFLKSKCGLYSQDELDKLWGRTAEMFVPGAKQ